MGRAPNVEPTLDKAKGCFFELFLIAVLLVGFVVMCRYCSCAAPKAPQGSGTSR